jgi:hypothetical protein
MFQPSAFPAEEPVAVDEAVAVIPVKLSGTVAIQACPEANGVTVFMNEVFAWKLLVPKLLHFEAIVVEVSLFKTGSIAGLLL